MALRRSFVATLGFVCSVSLVAAQEPTRELPDDPIPNWTAPPFWTSPQAAGLEKLKESGVLEPTAADALPTGPLPFFGITPCRIVDTRGGGVFTGVWGPPAMVANDSRDFDLNSAPHCSGIPDNAQAYSINVTVTQTTGLGDVRIWPAGSPPVTPVSTQNWPTAGLSIANAAIIPAGTDGAITVYVAGTSTHLIIDINGYYAPTSIVTTVNGLSGAVTLAPGSNISITPSGNTLTIANTALAAWLLTGNSLSTPGQFLGTTNNQPLEFKVNGQRAFRLEPHPTSPNVVGGFGGNLATGQGSTIAGGGFSGSGNLVTSDFGTVGGGYENQAGLRATVGGGVNNGAIGTAATVPGGTGNTALGNNTFAAGSDSHAGPDGSFALGSSAFAQHTGAFVWSCCAGQSFSSRDNQFQVRADGGATFLRGLAASAPTSAALQVENGPAGGEAAWLYNRNSANADDVVRALKHPSAPGNFFRCTNYDGMTTTNKCHIDANGTFIAGSDFAEALPARGGKARFAPGDVLVASRELPGQVEKSARRYDTRVIGVYSTRPGFVGADKNGETRVDPDDVPVAITGIVPTNVTSENGPIEPGDLLTTSSTPGFAMKATPISVSGVDIYPTGTILGKALTPLVGEKGKLRMLVLPR